MNFDFSLRIGTTTHCRPIPIGPEITINGLAFLGRDFFLPHAK